MSVEIIEQLLTDVVSQLKYYDLLVDNMSIGEVVSALALCSSSFDDDKDYLFMLREVYSIEVKDGCIEVHFVDGNTTDIKVFPDGRKECLSYGE